MKKFHHLPEIMIKKVLQCLLRNCIALWDFGLKYNMLRNTTLSVLKEILNSYKKLVITGNASELVSIKGNDPTDRVVCVKFCQHI